MAVERIGYNDKLREGTDKLNKSIDQSNIAAEQAQEALVKSNESNIKSNNVQQQLNQVVIEGDSSVEAAQARVADEQTFATLKERLDDRDVKLAQKVEQSQYDDDITAVNQNLDNVNKLLEGITFSGLSEPVYFAHRGAKNIFPESSQEAYRGCVNMGLTVIEMDVRAATDGTLIVHHDDTMERTTNKTGDVSRYSAMGFKSATIDLLPGWEGTPVLFEDLMREFGNKVVYAPEIKGPGIDVKLVDVILKYNLENNAIIQSFSAPDLTYAISKGIPVVYLKAQNDVPAATIKGWGINHVGLSTSLPDSYVTECVNAGLKVYMYTVNRRYEHDKYLSLGVDGFFTDDPLWISGESPSLDWDPYRDQVFTHGHFSPSAVSDYTGGNRGGFVSPNKFGWTTESTKADFSLQGWIGELSSTFSMSFKMNLVDSVSSVRWGSVAFCTPKDYFDDYSDSLSQGYHLLVRESGAIELYIRQGGPASSIGSMQTPALSQGDTADIQIQVTSTQVIITRTDTEDAMTINNSVHRGGYVHFGRRLSGVTFENVNVVKE